MAKGDTIEVIIGTPDGSRAYALVASKAGRSVKQTTRTRQKVQWLDVEEMTRTGRPTGNRLAFRLAGVLAVKEETQDVPDEPVRKVARAKRDAATAPLGLDA